MAHDFEYRFNAAGVSAIVCTADGDLTHRGRDGRAELPQRCTSKGASWAAAEKAGTTIDNDVQACSRRTIPRTEDDSLRQRHNAHAVHLRHDRLSARSRRTAINTLSVTTSPRSIGTASNSGRHTLHDIGHRLGQGALGQASMVSGCVRAAVFTYDFDKFDAADILPMFAKYHITSFCAPPTMLPHDA